MKKKKTAVRNNFPGTEFSYYGKNYIFSPEGGELIVPVMHPNLKGKTDLHGKPYMPSLFTYKIKTK